MVMLEVSVGIMINQVVSGLLLTEQALETAQLLIINISKLFQAGVKVRCLFRIDGYELFG